MLAHSDKQVCVLWVESRRAGFPAIQCALGRLMDHNAGFSEKPNTSRRLTKAEVAALFRD